MKEDDTNRIANKMEQNEDKKLENEIKSFSRKLLVRNTKQHRIEDSIQVSLIEE